MSRRIDKEKLVAAIKQSQELSDEQKADIIELIRAQKKYGLVWEDSPEDAEQELKSKLPILREVLERRILNDADGEHYPNHILIEGENLQALVALTYMYSGKIDVIYLDPPYNTGNGDFTYNDNIVDEEDEYRHSKWLSFMKKRLLIAKKLLSESGVIFISIDDYSQAQLKILCDSIFECSSNPKNSNFITTLIWNKQHSQQQGVFKKYHEYVLLYAKKKSQLGNVLSSASGIIEAGAMKKISVKNPASEFTFPAGVKVEAPDGTSFCGTYGDSEKVTVVQGPFVVQDGKTVFPIVLSAGWTQKKQMKSWFDGYETIDTKGQKIIEFYFNSTGKIKCRKQRGAITPSSFLPEFGMGSEQTSHLEEIMGVPNSFTNPKPVDMIKLFAEWFCPTDGLVLDFFAGSGTTMESVMQLNAEDGGHRQCILVTNNENGICENVTYERNKHIIQGYTTPKGEEVPGLTKNNLRYYKLKAVPRDSSTRSRIKLAAGSVDMLCIMENLYKEKDGFGNMGYYKGLRYFEENGRGMLVLLNTDLIPKVVEQLKRMDPSTPVHIYIYAPGDYAFDDEFEEVADKVELYPLPQPILNAYKNWLPKQDEVMLDVPDDYELTEAEQNESAKDFISKEE